MSGQGLHGPEHKKVATLPHLELVEVWKHWLEPVCWKVLRLIVLHQWDTRFLVRRVGVALTGPAEIVATKATEVVPTVVEMPLHELGFPLDDLFYAFGFVFCIILLFLFFTGSRKCLVSLEWLYL